MKQKSGFLLNDINFSSRIFGSREININYLSFDDLSSDIDTVLQCSLIAITLIIDCSVTSRGKQIVLVKLDVLGVATRRRAVAISRMISRECAKLCERLGNDLRATLRIFFR